MQDELLNQPGTGGILIQGTSKAEIATAHQSFLKHCSKLGLARFLETIEETDCTIRFRLCNPVDDPYPDTFNTLQLCNTFQLNPHTNIDDLEKEIFLSLLSGPLTFAYPSYAEFSAAIRIRINIVEAARRTALAFHTSKIERPADFWTYNEDRGFTILPGKQLIDALRKATQPETSGERYAFSCYRATEYVILLALAQEAAVSNPALLQQLQQQWESRAIMSRRFHDTFLTEFGSINQPLPISYYIPGDRLWFRNPDTHSADIDGYEGSWVFYLGNGLFSNFWEQEKPYTLPSKCIEIYHWRHGVTEDASGNLHMDEAVVAERVRTTLDSPEETAHILDLMIRLRDPQGVYADGGCIDASRECPRFICPESSDIFLPET